MKLCVYLVIALSSFPDEISLETNKSRGELKIIPAPVEEVEPFDDGRRPLEFSKVLKPQQAWLSWSLLPDHDDPKRSEIIIEIKANAVGWVGIGINHQPDMKGADMIVGGVRDTGPYLISLHGDKNTNTKPIKDEINDLEFLRATESNGITTFRIKRKLISPGTAKGHDIDILDRKYYVIHAYHHEDLKGDDDYLKHTHYGSTELSFFRPEFPPERRKGKMILHNYFLLWNPPEDGTTPKSSVVFEIKAKTTGWVGFGISRDGKTLKDSDVVVAGVRSDKKTYLFDQHITDPLKSPISDSIANYILLNATECDGWTTIKFRRTLYTEDNLQDCNITVKPQTLFFAIGEKDLAADGTHPEGNVTFKIMKEKITLLLEEVKSGAQPKSSLEFLVAFSAIFVVLCRNLFGI